MIKLKLSVVLSTTRKKSYVAARSEFVIHYQSDGQKKNL